MSDRPNLPGYVSIKEAAQILGISDKRVYEYVDDGRLTSMWAADVIMIPLGEVQSFRRKSSGRPRKTVPVWRVSSGDNALITTTIRVQIRNFDAFMQRLESLRQHTFPGTVARYITECTDHLHIILIWKASIMPDETEHMLNAFRQDTSDVLDWKTAQYEQSNVLMHT